jgi:HlyD family secretion protein
VLAGGKLKAVPVRFGLSDGRYTAITSDQLQPGVQVVVRAAVGANSSSSSSPASVPMAPRM